MTGLAARTYHDLTKHTWKSVRNEARTLDYASQPLPFKLYPELPPLPLPVDLAEPDWPALDALSGEPPPNAAHVDASWLASLLFLSGGVSRRWARGDRTVTFRTAASAGALYPTEVYVVCGDLSEEFTAGVYHFEPFEFALRRLRDGDHRAVLARAAADDGVAIAPISLVYTGMPGRSTWKYGARGYRHIFWDAGAAIANVLAVATSSNHPSRVVGAFIDHDVTALLGLDAEVEVPIAIVPLGRPGGTRPALPLTDEPVTAAVEPRTAPIGLGEYARKAQAAGDLVNAVGIKVWREAAHSVTADVADRVREVPLLPTFDSIAEVILRRGSTRRFTHATLLEEQFAWPLTVSAGALDADWLRPGTTWLQRSVAAHDVLGVEAGLHTWHDGRAEMIRPGTFRGEAAAMCLEQDLAGDAAAVVFHRADLHEVLGRAGDRGYRLAQLEAGIALGRLQLAAATVGCGSTGLTFYDDDVCRTFGGDAEPLTVVAWGRPAYTPRPGGRPRDVPPVRLRPL